MTTVERNVQDFYQSTDPDWAPAFKRAIQNGVSFYVPPGNYAIGTPLSITNNGGTSSGLRIRGLGQGAVIQANNSNFNLLTIGSSNTGTINVGLENLHFSTVPGVKLSGGSIISCINAARLQFRDVNIGSYEDYVSWNNTPYLYQGIVLNNCSTVEWQSGSIIGCQQQGVYAFSASGQSADISIDGQPEIVYCNVGVQLDGGCGGFSIGDADIQHNNIGLLVSAANGTNRELFLGYDCYLDTNTQYGMLIQNNGLVYLESTGTWYSGNGTNVSIQATQPGQACFKFTGARFYAGNGDGLQVASGQIMLTGCVFDYNGNASPGGQGLNITSPIPTPLINSCLFRGNGTGGGYGYGIGIVGSQPNFLLDGCVTSGNKSGAISAPAGTRGTNVLS